MSAPQVIKKKISIAAKLIRAFFIGQTIGLVGGFGLFLMAKAVNVLAGNIIVDPVSILVLTDGLTTVAATGVELSKDIGE